MEQEDSGLQEIPSRGRHYFGSLSAPEDEDQDCFHTPVPEEIMDDDHHAGSSFERIESCGISALITEGAELFDQLQPELAREFVDFVHESRTTSPLARELSRKVCTGNGLGRNASSAECAEGCSSMLSSSEQEYTMSMEDSHISCPSSPRQTLPPENLEAGPRSHEDAEKEASVSDRHSNATRSQHHSCMRLDQFDEDVRALFMACRAADNRNIDQDALSGQARVSLQLADPGPLRSKLMDHGFTAKQSSWILTRLEEEVGGGNMVSLEQLRAAVLPVLQECDGMIERYSRTEPSRMVEIEQDFIGNAQGSAAGTTNPCLLDDSQVSTIVDADAVVKDKNALQGNVLSAVAPSPARAESTQMDSICLSDIAENTYNKSDSTFGMSQDSCAHETPQKPLVHTHSHDLPRGPAIQERGLVVSQDSSCGPLGAEAPENVEKMARRVAAVCKKGVWKAWRGDAAGLDPIYSISLWYHTQTLLVNCGLVEVLALLLGGVTSELMAQKQSARSSTKLRLRLDGTVIHQSKFSRQHTLLAKSTLGILINLALNKECSECCRRIDGLRGHVEQLRSLPVSDLAHDAGRLLFLLDDCLEHRLGQAFSELLISPSVSDSSSGIRQNVGRGLVYMSYAKGDEQLMQNIAAGLRREGIQIVNRESSEAQHQGSRSQIDGARTVGEMEAIKSWNSGLGGQKATGSPAKDMSISGVVLPAHGPLKSMEKYGPSVCGMCRSMLQADVVLVIASLEYFESYRCRLEAHYLTNPRCHTVPVLIDCLPQDDETGEWEGSREKWLTQLAEKASRCVNGAKPTSVRTAVSVVKSILYSCGLSNDSAWSEMKTIKKPRRPPAKIGGDTLRVLNAISISNTGVHQIANHLEQEDVPKQSSAWDDTALQYQSTVTMGVQSGIGKASGSSHPDTLRASMPERPRSAMTRNPHSATLGPMGFTGGGGMGFNSSQKSKFSVVRGSSVGAAFNESTERFNPFFNFSRHDYRQIKYWTTLNPSAASASNVLPQNAASNQYQSLYTSSYSAQHPSPKLSQCFADKQKHHFGGADKTAASPAVSAAEPNTRTSPSDRPATAAARPASAGPSRPTSAGPPTRYSSLLPARSEAPCITISLETRSNPAASTSKMSRSYSDANSPSLQRWVGQPQGVGNSNGRADDLGASARTLAQFTRAPPHGPVRSFQRTSNEQRPHLIKHYAATAAATRASATPPDFMRQIGGLTRGLPVAPEKCSDSNVTSSVAPLLGAAWAPPMMKAPSDVSKLQGAMQRTAVPQLDVLKAVTQRDQEMRMAKQQKAQAP